MTFGNTDTDAKTVNHTWYKWDEDLSVSDADSAVQEATVEEETEKVAPTPVCVEKQPSTLSPITAAVSSVAGVLHDAALYLSYTRRWYTSLSSVGAAM